MTNSGISFIWTIDKCPLYRATSSISQFKPSTITQLRSWITCPTIPCFPLSGPTKISTYTWKVYLYFCGIVNNYDFPILTLSPLKIDHSLIGSKNTFGFKSPKLFWLLNGIDQGLCSEKWYFFFLTVLGK